jgi:flavodoxin
MNAVVVYESHWGNTAAIAQAIADGIGSGTRALTTDQATREALAGVDLIVAGSPVIAFALPRDGSLHQIERDEKAPTPPDVSHPLLRTWLDNLKVGHGYGAAFETRIWWSLRGATGTIESKLRTSGYERVLPGERFIVQGGYGPLRDGELERARRWGTELADAVNRALGKELVPA